MTAKEYLTQIRLLDLKIKQRTEEQIKLRMEALQISSPELSADKVQTSVSGDIMGDILVTCAELEREIKALICSFVRLRHRIIGEIQSLDDRRYVELLYLHYVDGKKLEEIACIMVKSNGEPYSYDHIASLHGAALQRFDEKILKSHGNPNFKYYKMYTAEEAKRP